MDFIGIGLTRSGTTWTWQQLVKHPQICHYMGKKEWHTFRPHLGKDAFDFIVGDRFRNCPKDKLVGEYTPDYIHLPYLPERIKEFCPNTRLLALLRNPVDRVFSVYKARQWWNHGKPKATFMSWFKTNEKYQPYINHLDKWIGVFGDQLRLDLYDDLVEDPLSYIQGVYNHLGIDDRFVPPGYEVREQKGYNLYYDKHPIYMKQEHRYTLQSFYRPQIEHLQEIIGRDLSHWLKR